MLIPKAVYNPNKKRAMWSKIAHQLLYVVYVAVVVAVMLEVVLRIYNPLQPRLKNDSIILPINKRYELTIDGLPTVKGKAVHTKNSLGFRGPEPPKHWSDQLTLLAVGGSTTECYFLGDGYDWPARLARRLRPALPSLWVNNAGLNGHSTYGHQVLLDNYLLQLKPDVILFLIGINDVGKDKMDGFDNTLLRNAYLNLDGSWWKNLARTVAQNSELISTVRLISQGIKTQNQHFGDNAYLPVRPADTLNISPARVQAELDSRRPFLKPYRARVLSLVTTCRRAGIEPILITQPLLVGFARDPTTQTNLATFRLHDTENGELVWKRLELYNNVTREVATSQRVHLIDLARELPKKSEYYYDEMHYTETGADRVSALLAQDLGPYLNAKYFSRSSK